jgi:hypothetical protein
MNEPSSSTRGGTADPAAGRRPESTSADQRARSGGAGGELPATRTWPFAHAIVRFALIAAACGLSLWHLGTYLAVVRARLLYPYALEWMEGGVLEHVARVLEGKPLYVEPSLEFTPFIYTPLYYWVCAPFARLFGLGLPALRMVSFGASLGIFGLLFAIVWKRTRNPVASLVAAGTFAAGFEVCGGYYDLARVDSLALFLLLLGIFLLRRHDSYAALCFAAAFFTKQSTAMVALPLLATQCITQSGARRFRAAAVFGTVTLGLGLLADRVSGGAYRYYVLDLPAQHPWYPQMRRDFWRLDVFENLPFAAIAALYLLTERVTLRAQLGRWAAALGFVASAWLSRLHAGGWINVLMPFVAFSALSLGEAVHRLGRESRSTPSPVGWHRALNATSSLFGLALCIAQLSWLLYAPASHIPSAEDRTASDTLVAFLKTLKGPVLVPTDPSIARLAGKSGSAHQQAITDVGLGRDKHRDSALEATVVHPLMQQHYVAVVTGGDWREQVLRAGYEAGVKRLATGATKEGAVSRQTEIWLRRPRKR